MKTILFIGFMGICFMVGGCSNETNDLPLDEVKHVVISAEDFRSESDSRTTLSVSSTGAVFSWAENDTVGIFPNDGAQVYFPMASGAGTKTASFTGGGWALKNGSTYAAYYPFIGNYYLDKEQLPMTYVGQTQKGNASTSHLGAFDYMAAPPTAPSESYVNFQFDHLNCLVQMRLTVPVATTFTELSLSCEQSIFTTKANLGLVGNNYSFTPIENAMQLNLQLSDTSSTAEGQVLTFYMMLAPVDMTSQTVFVTLTDENGKQYRGELESKNLLAGYSYDFPAVLQEVKDNLSAEGIVAPNLGESENII